MRYVCRVQSDVMFLMCKIQVLAVCVCVCVCYVCVYMHDKREKIVYLSIFVVATYSTVYMYITCISSSENWKSLYV